jgi:hypothetical protein
MSIPRNLSILADNASSAGVLSIAGGGTNTTSFSANQIHYGSFSQSAGLTFDGTNLATTGSFNSTNTFGFKNRMINGGMTIDQRSAGVSYTVPAGVTYGSCDRWQTGAYQASKFSVQQVSDAPTGFVNSLKATSLSAYTPASGDSFWMMQPIEGFNCYDFNFGTASATTVTLSFWVKSSLTGNFGGCLQNDAINRAYPFSYTINAASTWEKKTITIAGDTTGTWLKGANNGMGVSFDCGSGSSFTSTANTWAAGYYKAPTGATALVATSGATLQLAGVQLEKGSTATTFDFRSYGTELALCERYAQLGGGVGRNSSTTNMDIICMFRTDMRVSPTATTILNGTSTVAQLGLAAVNANSISTGFQYNQQSAGVNIVTSSSTLTLGSVCFAQGNTFLFSSEL